MSGREPDCIRCADCGGAVHPEEILYDKVEDDNVCPRCLDNRESARAEAR